MLSQNHDIWGDGLHVGPSGEIYKKLQLTMSKHGMWGPLVKSTKIVRQQRPNIAYGGRVCFYIWERDVCFS